MKLNPPYHWFRPSVARIYEILLWHVLFMLLLVAWCYNRQRIVYDEVTKRLEIVEKQSTVICAELRQA